MRCPQCHCLDDKVVDSRSTKEGAGVRRRRECLNCGQRFTTYEEVIQSELKVLKNNNICEDFDREKIRFGIEKACWKRPINNEDIDKITQKAVNEIRANFEGEVTTGDIGTIVMHALMELDEVAYVRFASVYRQFKDIDQFIDEIRTLGVKK
jgi:transcriptional repressor NrdR